MGKFYKSSALIFLFLFLLQVVSLPHLVKAKESVSISTFRNLLKHDITTDGSIYYTDKWTAVLGLKVKGSKIALKTREVLINKANGGNKNYYARHYPVYGFDIEVKNRMISSARFETIDSNYYATNDSFPGLHFYIPRMMGTGAYKDEFDIDLEGLSDDDILRVNIYARQPSSFDYKGIKLPEEFKTNPDWYREQDYAGGTRFNITAKMTKDLTFSHLGDLFKVSSTYYIPLKFLKEGNIGDFLYLNFPEHNYRGVNGNHVVSGEAYEANRVLESLYEEAKASSKTVNFGEIFSGIGIIYTNENDIAKSPATITLNKGKKLSDKKGYEFHLYRRKAGKELINSNRGKDNVDSVTFNLEEGGKYNNNDVMIQVLAPEGRVLYSTIIPNLNSLLVGFNSASEHVKVRVGDYNSKLYNIIDNIVKGLDLFTYDSNYVVNGLREGTVVHRLVKKDKNNVDTGIEILNTYINDSAKGINDSNEFVAMISLGTKEDLIIFNRDNDTYYFTTVTGYTGVASTVEFSSEEAILKIKNILGSKYSESDNAFRYSAKSMFDLTDGLAIRSIGYKFDEDYRPRYLPFPIVGYSYSLNGNEVTKRDLLTNDHLRNYLPQSKSFLGELKTMIDGLEQGSQGVVVDFKVISNLKPHRNSLLFTVPVDLEYVDVSFKFYVDANGYLVAEEAGGSDSFSLRNYIDSIKISNVKKGKKFISISTKLSKDKKQAKLEYYIPYSFNNNRGLTSFKKTNKDIGEIKSSTIEYSTGAEGEFKVLLNIYVGKKEKKYSYVMLVPSLAKGLTLNINEETERNTYKKELSKDDIQYFHGGASDEDSLAYYVSRISGEKFIVHAGVKVYDVLYSKDSGFKVKTLTTKGGVPFMSNGNMKDLLFIKNTGNKIRGRLFYFERVPTDVYVSSKNNTVFREHAEKLMKEGSSLTDIYTHSNVFTLASSKKGKASLKLRTKSAYLGINKIDSIGKNDKDTANLIFRNTPMPIVSINSYEVTDKKSETDAKVKDPTEYKGHKFKGNELSLETLEFGLAFPKKGQLVLEVEFYNDYTVNQGKLIFRTNVPSTTIRYYSVTRSSSGYVLNDLGAKIPAFLKGKDVKAYASRDMKNLVKYSIKKEKGTPSAGYFSSKVVLSIKNTLNNVNGYLFMYSLTDNNFGGLSITNASNGSVVALSPTSPQGQALLKGLQAAQVNHIGEEYYKKRWRGYAKRTKPFNVIRLPIPSLKQFKFNISEAAFKSIDNKSSDDVVSEVIFGFFDLSNNKVYILEWSAK